MHLRQYDFVALNVAVDDYEVGKIVDAYTVAESNNFSLFFSFDMSYDWQQADMASLISAHASSPSSFKFNGSLLVSSFAGQDNGNDFWSGLKSALAAQNINVVLAPAFTSDPFRDPTQAKAQVAAFPAIDGFFNWWSW